MTKGKVIWTDRNYRIVVRPSDSVVQIEKRHVDALGEDAWMILDRGYWEDILFSFCRDYAKTLPYEKPKEATDGK